MSSRLFQEIREQRGLVYSVYSFQAAYRARRACSAFTPERRRKTCSRASTSSVESSHRVRDEPIDAEELHLAKEHMKGNLTLSLESTSSRMIRLGRNEFAFGRHVTPEEIEQRIDAVTRRRSTGARATSCLTEENLGLAIIGPVDESAIAWT